MQSHLEATLAKLIAIRSVSDNADACHEVLEYVRSEIEHLGLFLTSEITTPHPWLLATTQDTKEPDVLLVCHLDVVPGDDELFSLRQEDGKLYGRGVYDMKFSAACYIELFKQRAHALSEVNLGILFTNDEELGGPSVPGILELGLRPKVAFIPDGGDNWHIEARAKGTYGVEIIASGKTAHGSRPWEGSNALHTLSDVLAQLRRSFPESDDPSCPTLSVTMIEAGKVINQIPDSASARIDFRAFERDELTRYQLRLDELAEQHNLEIIAHYRGLPLHFDKTAPSVQPFLRALEQFTGEPVNYRDSYGATDGRYFAMHDIPCIIIEPLGGGRHSQDEWIEQADLLRYYELLELWLFKQSRP